MVCVYDEKKEKISLNLLKLSFKQSHKMGGPKMLSIVASCHVAVVIAKGFADCQV